MKTSLSGLFCSLALAILPFAASADVSVLPSYYDFGPVEPGRSVSTTITFMNHSPVPERFFSVNCSGDYTVFSCFSTCMNLPAYGRCTVHVQFRPRNGDNQRKLFWITGRGTYGFATSTIYGTDEKTQR